MDISKFFIDRPIFAAVLSAVIFLAGAIAIFRLPVTEYPDVAPPNIVVRATYPGANPKVIAETVAAPLEEQINGVENMLYMSSQATTDGVLTLTVTFRIGTDVDLAETLVQNRVQRALPRLPDEVRQIGVVTQRSTPCCTMVVHILSPDSRYDELYLRNFAVLNIKDNLQRLPGMGEVQVFGAGDYAMRVWLDPQKLAARNLTASDVVRALREQNKQVAAGVVGAPLNVKEAEFQLSVNARRRRRPAPQGRGADRARRGRVRAAIASQQQAGGRDRGLPGVRVERDRAVERGPPHDGRPQAGLSGRRGLPDRLRPDAVRAAVDRGGRGDAAHRDPARGARRHRVPADLARVDHPARRGPGVDRWHLRVPAAV